MPFALIAAVLADGHACLQQRPGGAGVIFRQAADDPAGGGADIGAVPAQPDARDHLGQVLLAQVSVGIGGAGPGTSLIASMAAASTLASTLRVCG